jgi:hypothetical protein
MNANDARLVRLFTTETAVPPAPASLVEDNSPNTSLGAALATFDLVIEGEAGANIGGTGAPYTLAITCFDWTTGNLANAALAPTIPPQTFDGNAAKVLWKKSGSNFLTQQRFLIPNAGNLPAGLGNHIFVYTAVLVTQDFNIVSVVQSNLFLLV